MKFEQKALIVLGLIAVVVGICVYYIHLKKNPNSTTAKKMKATFCEPSPTWLYPPRPAARTIMFPEGKEIGTLYTTTSGVGYVRSHSWELLGPAKGKIALPDETAAFLEVKQGSSDLLSTIALDGIQVIDFSAHADLPFELYVGNQTKRVVQLPDEDLKSIKNIKTLYRLILHNTTITDKGLTYIAEMKSLRSINLFNTKITNDGLQLLTQLPYLRGLDLGATDISDNGLKHLGDCTRLERLNLTGSDRIKGKQAAGASSQNLNITDRGIVWLGSLISLSELNISDTNVTDQSIQTISELKSLRYLNVSGTMISEEGIKKIKASLPDCQIIDNPGIMNR